MASLPIDCPDRSGCRSGQRQRCGGHEVQAVRLAHDGRRGECHVLGKRAGLDRRRQQGVTDQRATYLHVVDARPHGLNDSGRVTAEHERILLLHDLRQHADCDCNCRPR